MALFLTPQSRCWRERKTGLAACRDRKVLAESPQAFFEADYVRRAVRDVILDRAQKNHAERHHSRR
ncbi:MULTISPECIES: hypothetical protein [unclassified Marinovum]